MAKSQAAPSTFGGEALKTRMGDFFAHANQDVSKLTKNTINKL